MVPVKSNDFRRYKKYVSRNCSDFFLVKVGFSKQAKQKEFLKIYFIETGLKIAGLKNFRQFRRKHTGWSPVLIKMQTVWLPSC